MKNRVNHDICMNNENDKDKNSNCEPTQQEIESDIDKINPDENTLDRG